MSFEKILYQISTFFSWFIIAFPATGSLNHDPTFIQIILFFIILFFIKYKKINVCFYITSYLYMLVIALPIYINCLDPYLEGLGLVEILNSLTYKFNFNRITWTWFAIYIPLYIAATLFLVNKESIGQRLL